MLTLGVGCDGGKLDSVSADSGAQSVGLGIDHDRAVRKSRRPAVEAGVILSNRASYLCWPAERLGIPAEDEIVSLETSCECVEAKVVYYLDPTSQTRRAISLDFIPDDDGDAPSRPANLSVKTSVHLASGNRREFEIGLLHTQLSSREP